MNYLFASFDRAIRISYAEQPRIRRSRSVAAQTNSNMSRSFGKVWNGGRRYKSVRYHV